MARLIGLLLAALWLATSLAGPARAFPVAVVAGWLGVSATSFIAAAATFILNTAIAIGLNVAVQKVFGPKSANAGQARQASVLNLTIGEGPRMAIFGRAATGGQLLDAFNFGGTNKTDWEVLVIKVADHKCYALDGFLIGDTFYAYSGDGAQPGFNGQLEVYWMDGDPAQAASSYLTTNSPNRLYGTRVWGANDVCASQAVFIAAYKADDPKSDNPVWPQGRPNFKPVVKGKLCYDPRKDSTVAGGSGLHRWTDPTTWEWTDNAEVCRYNYDRGIYAKDQVGDPTQLLIGRGLSDVEAPPADVSANANICDEAVTLKAGGTEARYRVGGVVFANETFIEVEQKFADAMGGDIVKRNGGVQVLAGVAQSTVAEITDDDLVLGEPVSYQPFLSDQNRINTVIVQYVEPSQLWNTATAPIRTSTADVSADGGQKNDTPSLDLVTSQTQAQRIGEIRRRLARMERRAAIVLPPPFSNLEDGDWVGWTSARYFGGARVVFRVEAYSVGQDYRTKLVLREIASTAYDWTAATDEGVPGQAPVDEFGSLTAVSLAGAAATAVGLVGASGAAQPSIKATWTTPVDKAIRAVVLEVRKQGSTDATPTRQDNPNAGTVQTTAGVMSGVVMEWRLVPVPFDPARTATATAWATLTTTSLVTPNRITTSQTAPVSPNTGDIWVKTDSNGRVVDTETWNGTAWVVASTKNNVTVSASAPATPTINDFWVQLDANGRVTGTFYWNGTSWAAAASYNKVTQSATAPSTPTVNDLWVVLDANGRITGFKTWNGSAWVATATMNNVTSSATAPATPVVGDLWVVLDANGRVTGFSTWSGAAWVQAGTKNTVSSGTSAPSTPTVNDVWVDTTTSGKPVTKIWNGSAWVSASIPASVVTYLDANGNITSVTPIPGGVPFGMGVTLSKQPFTTDASHIYVAAFTMKLYGATDVSVSAATIAVPTADSEYGVVVGRDGTNIGYIDPNLVNTFVMATNFAWVYLGAVRTTKSDNVTYSAPKAASPALVIGTGGARFQDSFNSGLQ